MDINSLLFTCEHPKHIITKDGRTMTVSCGKCLSCIVQKCRARASVVSQHEKLYKYCFFVTLTYDRYNVPVAKAFKLHDHATGRQYVELYDEDTGDFLGSTYYSHNLLDKLVHRSDDGCLHYCRYSDAQKFLKRLRRKINYYKKYDNEKITYYCVSEYGPRTFRPHFHILFYFDSPILASDFGCLVRSSWSLGYSYTTLSKGQCHSYVSSYVNSFVSLPEVFKVFAANPKCSHSSCLALPLSQSAFKEMLKNEPTTVVRYCKHTDNKGNVSFSAPWRSFKSYCYPKCYRYASKSPWERYVSYGCLQTLYERYGKIPLKHIAQRVKNDFYKNNLPYSVIVAILTPQDGNYILPSDDILLSRIYELKHYYHLCKLLETTPRQLTSLIDEFYSALDYTNLKEMYEVVQQSEHILSPSDYELFSQLYCFSSQLSADDYVQFNGILLETNLIKDMYFHSSLYEKLVNSRKQSFNTSVKHKELNDLNNIFLINTEYGKYNVYEVD